MVGKRVAPAFRPPKDHLNCDPSLELEEMIVEAKPLHKKKKRLAKQRSIQRDTDTEPQTQLVEGFLIYNRFKEVHRRQMEQKELDWEQELTEAMANSEVHSSTAGPPTMQVTDVDSGGGGEGVGELEEGTVRVTGKSVIDFIDRTPSPKPSA